MPRLLCAPELPRIVKSLSSGESALRCYNYLGEVNYFDLSCIYGIVTSDISVSAKVDDDKESVSLSPARTGTLMTNAGTFLTSHSAEELGMCMYPED